MISIYFLFFYASGIQHFFSSLHILYSLTDWALHMGFGVCAALFTSIYITSGALSLHGVSDVYE
jgi:hypothetical protein